MVYNGFIEKVTGEELYESLHKIVIYGFMNSKEKPSKWSQLVPLMHMTDTHMFSIWLNLHLNCIPSKKIIYIWANHWVCWLIIKWEILPSCHITFKMSRDSKIWKYWNDYITENFNSEWNISKENQISIITAIIYRNHKKGRVIIARDIWVVIKLP